MEEAGEATGGGRAGAGSSGRIRPLGISGRSDICESSLAEEGGSFEVVKVG